MKYAYYGFVMIFLGIVGLVVIVMMQSITINNDSEYYNLKEAMKAAMIESIDITCYRTTNHLIDDECGNGKLKISEQKFVENFTRRFVQTVGGDASSFEIEFYDIIESPPKASVVIRSSNDNYTYVSGQESINITNSLTGILEQDYLIKLEGKGYKTINLDEVNKGYLDLIEEQNKIYEERQQQIINSQKEDTIMVDEAPISIEVKEEKSDSSGGFVFTPADSYCENNACDASGTVGEDNVE